MPFQLSESIVRTGAMENETVLRIEALRLSIQLGGFTPKDRVVERAEKFYKFMKDGEIPEPEAPTGNA